jgi:hypothetical protein
MSALQANGCRCEATGTPAKESMGCRSPAEMAFQVGGRGNRPAARIRSPIVTGLKRSGCGWRRLLALFRSRSSSTSSGRREISLEIRRASFIGQADVGQRWRIWLAIDMCQDHAIGIDDPVSAGHRFDCQGLGNWREGMAGASSDGKVIVCRSFSQLPSITMGNAAMSLALPRLRDTTKKPTAPAQAWHPRPSSGLILDVTR